VSASGFDVLVVGELNADVIVTGADVAPVFGEVERLVDDAALTLGASGAIFACGAARLGLDVGYVGRHGDDAIARFVLRSLADAGVDTSLCRVDEALPTGLTVILSQPDDRAVLTALGATAATTSADVPAWALERSRHIHVSSYYLQTALQPGVPEMFARARRAGATTSLDTNWDPAEEWGAGIEAALAGTDLFLPNRAEAVAIARASTLDAALDRLSRTAGTVAVKLGGEGAIAACGSVRVRVPAPPIDVVDTTGAGDSFDAGFVAARLWSWGLEDALRFAATCGALATRAPGGTGSQPTAGEAAASAGLEIRSTEVQR
jgi:sugar/nucleoside kinase (ribokinase family)